jgi:hypothetical protein
MAPHNLNFDVRWMLGSTSGSCRFTLRKTIAPVELGGFADSILDVVEKILPRLGFEPWDFQPVIWSLYGFSGSGMWGHGVDRAGSE